MFTRDHLHYNAANFRMVSRVYGWCWCSAQSGEYAMHYALYFDGDVVTDVSVEVTAFF
jgi:hypothetical protein